MKKLIALLSLSCLLQGCIFVVGAAAGAAAIAMVYDHRPVEDTIADTKLANKISDKIFANRKLKEESHIDVTVFNRIVLLTGETPNQEWHDQAEEIAKSFSDVSRVYNQITIQGPTSSLTRTSDSWISTKIKTQLLAHEELKTNTSSIKVVTESGVVYLMGEVTHQQADIAVDVAREVSGVQKVIKIFQYTNANPA